MKFTSAITIGLIAVSSLFAGANYNHTAINGSKEIETIVRSADEDFEKAVALIKKYEGLHQPKHWPLVGYGHRVLPGEKFSRSKALSEKEADALLRKDLRKNCAVFRQFGADSLILGVLAYNIGSGAALRSSVTRKLKAGDRDIYESYVAHSRYRGKTNSQIKKRRIEEFETLFIKDTDAKTHSETARPLHEEETEQQIRPVRRLSNLYTPAMRYPLHLIPQLRSADEEGLQLAASRRGGATKGDATKSAYYNTQTACISRSQQYYWL